MGKVIKIIKINLLSLLALPLLLIATACKFISKAFEKLLPIGGMSLLTFGLYLVLKFVKTPDATWLIVLLAIGILAVMALLIFLAILLVRVASEPVKIVVDGLVSFFNLLYSFTYIRYLKLYEICEADYRFISLGGNKYVNGLCCLFFSIVRGLTYAIVFIADISLYLSIGGSAFLVIFTLWRANSRIQTVFGLGIFAYLQKFDMLTLVCGILYFLSLMTTLVIILLSLGIEWHEWANELKMSKDRYTKFVDRLQKKTLSIESKDGGDASGGYIQVLNSHIQNLDPLETEINTLLSTRENQILRALWGEYLRELKSLTDYCSSRKKDMSQAELQRLIPRIQDLDKQRNRINEMIGELKETYSNPVKNSFYFAGCNTLEKLDKRYKSLCKTYHPDADSGDEESFKQMQAEYEKLKQTLSATTK